jgi:hypothetical protein
MPEKNGRAAVELIRGIRILSAPDAAGDFDIERSTQQIGEAVSETFLAPHRREDRLVSAGCDSPTGVSADPARGRETTLSLPISLPLRNVFGFRPQQSRPR